ncbi:MAG: hypothetical protein HY261_09145 [Chloroflexi bacterium]|nr:hypothetical protein [Chloroflexota bacterium]
MFIKVEPKSFNMYNVFLVFNKEEPGYEDEHVKTYLAEHGLSAKEEMEQEYAGAPCRVMRFGGCYLEPHMARINALNRTGNEVALLRRQIDCALTQRPPRAVTEALAALRPAALERLKARLLDDLHQPASFGPDKRGYLSVKVTVADVRRRFLALASEQRLAATG